VKTILIVDDDPGLLECLHQALRLFGHRVIPVQDAMSALAVIHNGAAIDLVITDYHMPGMHGLELAEKLRQTAPAVPVIMCSAFADQELPDKARGAGVAVFVDKPYSLQGMKGIVRDVLDNSAQHRAGSI